MIDYGKITIPRRARHCFHGQEPFTSGAEYVSLIIEEPKDLIRQDYCMECWNHVQSQLPSKIYWKAKLPEKSEGNPEELSHNEKVFALLRESDDVTTCFVLALYLARKKKLILRQDLEEAMIYEVPETEEMIVVKKVDLSLLEETKVQQSIADLLK